MRLFLVCIYLLCFFAVNAQTSRPAFVDTLEIKLNNTKGAADKIKILSRLSDYYQTADPKLAQKYEGLGLAVAKQAKRDSDVCVFYGYIGETYILVGDLKNGIRECNNEVKLANKHGYKKFECLALSDIGLAYQMQGDYPQSQDYYFRGLSLAEQINNRFLEAMFAINISSNYLNQNNFDQTILYAQKGLGFCKGFKINIAGLIAKADELIGSSYVKQNRLAKAQGYYTAALKLYQKSNDENGIATIYTVLVETYAGNSEKQLEYGLKAQKIWDKLGPQNLYAISNLGNLGSAYGTMARQQKVVDNKTKNKLFDKAENYLWRAIDIAKQSGSKQNIIFFTDSLAVIDAERGKYKEAYNNLVAHNQLSDSVYSQENKNKIASIEGKHDIALKVKEIQINKLEIANQQKQKWFLIGGLLTVFIIAALIYFQSLQRKKTNTTLLFLNNELDEANKVKMKFFSILNHDLRSPVASFVNFLHLQRHAPDLIDAAASEAYSKKATIAAENLLNTMEDLLLWSKGQMENFKPSNRVIEVNELFEYFKESLTMPENIQIDFDHQPGMTLNVDEHYLKTIMHNLTNNAVKALGPAAGSFITWKAWEEGPQKYLSITDNGPGATQEAFKPLYDDSAPIGIKNGLGLHIVRDLAKAISCQLSVSLKPGSGVELKLKFS